MIGTVLIVVALLLAAGLCAFCAWDKRHDFPSLGWKHEELVVPVVFILFGCAATMYVVGMILWVTG